MTKPVFLLAGNEAAVLLAKTFKAHHQPVVFVANTLASSCLKTYGEVITYQQLPKALQNNPQSCLLLLGLPPKPNTVVSLAKLCARWQCTMWPNARTGLWLSQSNSLAKVLALPEATLLAADVQEMAAKLGYPLLLQGPLLDANNFYQVVRKPKQLSWALDNAKALGLQQFRLRRYQEVQQRFLLQTGFAHGKLYNPTVIGLNNEHGLLHEAWLDQPLKDHIAIKANALTANLAFTIAQQGIISAFYSVAGNYLQLENFAPWPVLAGWVAQHHEQHVYQQLVQLALAQPWVEPARCLRPVAALKLQANVKMGYTQLLDTRFNNHALFYQQGRDVREVVRGVIQAANQACL